MTELRTFDPERRSLHDEVAVDWDEVVDIVRSLNVRMDRVLDDRVTDLGPSDVIDQVVALVWSARSVHDLLAELIRSGEG